ncbi:MAG: DHA2 family efflux MFS transporter permease subunit, partial [Vampirovibrionia bacterium]
MSNNIDNSIIHPNQLLNRENKWIVTVSIMLAATMATLDTSIVNVAIPEIRASFGANLTEISWVATAYMIANVIMITVSGWLSDILGRRNYFLICVIVFTIASFLCGISWSLNSLILFRIIQGIGGGALLPISLTILFETFSKKEHTTAMSIYALGATVGPALGPVLGGWLTDTFGWEMIFFINVPIGILVVIMCLSFVTNYGLFEKASKFDTLGFTFIALSLGSLQFVLEEGQIHDWFKSDMILFTTIFSIVCFFLFIATELIIDKPLIDLNMFINRNFSAGIFIIFSIGFILLSLIYIIPLYAST